MQEIKVLEAVIQFCITIKTKSNNYQVQLEGCFRKQKNHVTKYVTGWKQWLVNPVLKEFQRVSKDIQTDNSVLNLELWPWPWSDLSHTCAHQNRFMVLYMSAKAFQNVTNPSRVIERTCNTVIQCLTLNYDSKPTWVKHTWHLCIVICKSYQGFKR